jgi:hypothetical protein
MLRDPFATAEILKGQGGKGHERGIVGPSQDLLVAEEKQFLSDPVLGSRRRRRSRLILGRRGTGHDSLGFHEKKKKAAQEKRLGAVSTSEGTREVWPRGSINSRGLEGQQVRILGPTTLRTGRIEPRPT